MLSRDKKRELASQLRDTNKSGTNIIIGWRRLVYRIELFQLPIFAITDQSTLLTDHITTKGHYVDDNKVSVLKNSGCTVTEIEFDFPAWNHQEIFESMEDAIRPYVIHWYPCRAVALFDIVDFSKYPAFVQMAQIRMLSYFIKFSAQRCRALGHKIEIQKSTTGDGFYVWNERCDVEGDISLYQNAMLTLAYYYAARKSNLSNNLAELRCCVNFGSNFSYQGAMENDPKGGNYIVGDVTIGLARMMSAALPSQLLMGSHSRNISRSGLAVTLGRNMLDTTSLLALGQRSIEELNGFTLPGGKITSVKSYLTGARVSSNEFSIKKYSIVDKHGLDHECYNAKLNLLLSNGSAVHVGRLDRDLAEFQGTEIGDKGIVIRIQ